MAYTDTLLTDLDYVRFLIGDTGATPILTDNEISKVVTDEPNKWYAAAVCLEAMLMKWRSAEGGITEKQVGDLEIRYGGGASGESTMRKYARELRITGSTNLRPAPKALKVL